ncbi:hypothetical protein V866_000041 [Kwoniella sp. B9012]|uniref:Uncharacterized protein n=1 Tax=Kwoniella europaea PYCC6329 TaxID=1423913 RepID=A0AAX4K764_9TREE
MIGRPLLSITRTLGVLFFLTTWTLFLLGIPPDHSLLKWNVRSSITSWPPSSRWSKRTIISICFAMDVGCLQTTLRRIAQIKSKIDVLDTNKTCQAPSKEFRKLHDDLIKYCKDRDPDEKLFLFDYKAPSTKSDFETMMMMAMMKFMDM